MKTIIYGFLGCGTLATLGFFISQFLGKKSNIQSIIHSVTQKIGKDNIQKIEEKQKPLIKKIENSEKLTENTKEKIKEIKKKANKEIVEILNDDKGFPELLEEENELW